MALLYSFRTAVKLPQMNPRSSVFAANACRRGREGGRSCIEPILNGQRQIAEKLKTQFGYATERASGTWTVTGSLVQANRRG